MAASAGVTETLPAGFAYVPASFAYVPASDDPFRVVSTGQNVRFTLQNLDKSFTYAVTASSTDGTYSFSGTLRDDDRDNHIVGGDTDVTVSADAVTGPDPVDAGDGLQFDVVPDKAVKGAVVSGLNHPIGSNPLEWDVSDVATGTLVSIANDGIVGDFQVKDAGSGIFRLEVMTSGAPSLSGSQSINVALSYDDDTTVNLTGDINEQDALTFTNSPFDFTISQAITAGTPIGAFDVDGDVAGEYLDGIVSGDDSGPFEVRDSDMALVYKGGSLEVKTYNLDLTVSGDAGMANRTIIEDVMVTVTASNLAPTAPATFAETVSENDPSDAELVKADTVVGDASAGVNANDGDSLKYTPQGNGASVFKIDEATGMITVGSDGISASTGGPDDDPATEDADAKYTRSDGGELVDDTYEFSDITYTFMVMVSDGISANNQYITATVTVDVNEPTQIVADAALPANVTAGMVNHDGDGATDMVPGYKIVVSVTDGDVPMTLVNLGALVSDADSGDDLSFDVSGNPSHVIHDKSSDNLDLTYLPPSANPGPRVDTITVDVSDSYNGADTADQTLYIEISVTEEEPDPITSEFVSITVAENSTDCMQDGSMGCSLAGEVPNAVSYSIESGVDGGDTDYSVDSSTGVITVNTAPNFEDGKNPAFLVNAKNALGELAGLISVRVAVTDVDEDPVITPMPAGDVAWVYENFQIGDAVVTKVSTQAAPDAANDPDTKVVASDPEGMTLTYSIENKVPFSIDSDGTIRVDGVLEADDVAAGTHKTHVLNVRVADPSGNASMVDVTVVVLNANETPQFTSPTGDDAVTTIPENTGNALVIFTFTATDEDRDDLTFTLREGQSRDLFVIENTKSEIVGGDEVWSGELHVKTGVTLDFEDPGYDPRVHVEANDPEGLNATLLLTVNLSNVNDNDPAFIVTPATSLSVPENTARGFVLANYAASDADGDSVSYSLSGDDAKSFSISGTGNLMTLESLDADRQVPCGAAGCAVTVVASDGERSVSASVRVSVTAIEDSVSTLGVTKANPVPGTESGRPMSALAGTKSGGDEYLWNLLDCAGMLELVDSTDRDTYCKMWDGLSAAAKTKVSAALTSDAPAESPYSLPASYGSAPVNFVETEWANWGTILRIEVTAESPAVGCGNGNQCVVIDVNSDSADTSIKLQAYRSGSQENKFVAALMLVELDSEATDSDSAVFAHSDDSVARLNVDEEDEIQIKFGNLRGSLDIENEDPEISNFAPEHEAAFDDADVDYTFTVTDSHSGLPEPEDLPDVDGDDAYTPVVALISKGQCETVDNDNSTESKARRAKLIGDGFEVVEDTEAMLDGESLYCPGDDQDGEYDASGSGYGFAPIRDDRDFDEIDDGFEVETTIVLRENKTYYVTFIACDNAGNCTFYDPDGNDDAEELAKITVDTEDPIFVEARTGLTWDSTDNEYDDNRSFIQVIFNDLTNLNTATVEIDDFVVEGHTITDVHIFENPDDDDVDWTDSGRYGAAGQTNKRGIDRYRDLENVVFVELEDELLADETPDVTVVPNGVEDKAGNEQDDGDHEADDWISPAFTIVSIVSTRETSQDEILAGDDDEVTVVVTSDERLDSTRPTVTVTYVNAPSGSVDTKGIAACDDKGNNDGTRERGEIVHTNDCADSGAATGGTLNNNVEKVSNTEWIVTITEPKATGYYNFHIGGKDRSPQENPGSEGVSPGAIVSDFFDADGDVNVDDAIFFEGDINLPKPNVRVSGFIVHDNEANVEFRSPLFVELDFAANHSTCSSNADTDERMANCMNENSEYAEDNFDDIVVTSFMLDGVDITDSVKTTDNQSFLVSLESISIGDHTATVQAVDQAGNVFEDTLEIDFEVNDRDPFEKRLSPGWNLVSLPGEPADSSIAAVFGPGVEVRTVYTYDPVIPGGWQVAVRETLDSDWQGDLTEITGQHGYWVLSDAIQDWEVSIPRLAGGAAGTGTPIQPPVIPLYAGWNLIPVSDISGNGEGGQTINADVYLQSLDDGVDLARVLGFDTIRNQWETVLDPDMQMNNTLEIGAGYWIFVREATSLVPSGYVGGGGGD